MPIIGNGFEIGELLDNLILRKGNCEGVFQFVDVPDCLLRYIALRGESRRHFR